MREYKLKLDAYALNMFNMIAGCGINFSVTNMPNTIFFQNHLHDLHAVKFF